MNQLPEHDLPPGRHRLLKEHLMTEIRRTEEPARVRNRWLRPAITAAAVAAVAAVTFVVLPASSGGGTGAELPTGTGAEPQAGANTAAALLEDIALAAEHENAYGDIKDDQFVYVDSKVSYAQFEEGKKVKIAPLHRWEEWHSVDGTREGLIQAAGRGQRSTDPDPAPGKRGYDVSTNYRHLSTLPTDPEEMYDWLRKTAPENSGQVTDQAMFVLVGDLIRDAIVPPEQSAALYRAVARIPGVTVVQDAVDAAGRHGIAIARKDPDNPSRDEWIFDRKTHEFLGERSVLTADLPKMGAKKGQVTANTAVLGRAVVDTAGERP